MPIIFLKAIRGTGTFRLLSGKNSPKPSIKRGPKAPKSLLSLAYVKKFLKHCSPTYGI